MQNLSNKQLKKITKIIQQHLGKTNPIQVDEIARRTNLSDREIRKAVQSLVNEHWHPIGATTKGPHGYFIIANQEDYDEAIKNLSNREKKISERIMKLIQNCQREGIKVKNYKKKISDRSTTINIQNLYLINLKNED
jgi:predicted DNA-binding transcriptional regulator